MLDHFNNIAKLICLFWMYSYNSIIYVSGKSASTSPAEIQLLLAHFFAFKGCCELDLTKKKGYWIPAVKGKVVDGFSSLPSLQ